MSYADTRREQYRADIDAANAYYRDTADLAGYQTRAAAARDGWHADVRAHYADPAVENDLAAALALPGRVYADLATGERVRVHNVDTLYAVSDTTGAPAEPIIACMAGGFTVLDTTIADMIGRA